ncbi:MAG: PD-(D/E)XK nuclease family protein, partial [Bacteroidales bacterium]|nr:PD-(D/E)XK nuclease family protein [Bacteroidales bacterium]
KILKNSLILRLEKMQGSEIINDIIDKNLLWIPSDRFSSSGLFSNIFRKPSSPALISEYLKAILLMISIDEEETEGKTGQGSVLKNIRNEFIYRIILALNRLDAVANDKEIDLSTGIWTRILDRLLRSQSVPFSGEPLSGIQIMGILETRTLDFRNLIILSVNEGVLPAVTSASSFIPFSLREAFGLQSINHQESIYAYHFYRLLHRAENVTFVYNSDSEGLRSGEMSRFLQQMIYGSVPAPRVVSMNFEIRNFGSVSSIVERREEHNVRLAERFSDDGTGGKRYISPSMVNTWLNCRMRFYYRYVNELDERDKISEEIDPAMLGTLLHAAIRDLYAEFQGRLVDPGMFGKLISNKKKIGSVVNNAIQKKFNRGSNSDVAGNDLIVREVLIVFIERILQIDRSVAPVLFKSFEDSYVFPVSLMNDLEEMKLTIGGKIDRVDVIDGTTRIIDYKTGMIADSVKSLGALFEDDRKKELDGWLQTLMYCEAYLAENPETKIIPSIYKLKKIPGEQVSEKLRIGDRGIVEDYRE